MKFKLSRQKINKNLNKLFCKKIRQNKIYVPRITRKNLNEITTIVGKIRKAGLPKHLVIKKLKGNLGRGIFLHPEAKPIQKGAAIAPYSGTVFVFPQNQDDSAEYTFSLISDLHLTRKEQLVWDPHRRYHPRRLYSIDLDAQKKGNFTRFVNHSKNPNVEAVLVRIPANSIGVMSVSFELIYIAKKVIWPGEQLLVCYEGEDNSYWGALNIKPFPMTPKTFQLNSFLKIATKVSF